MKCIFRFIFLLLGFMTIAGISQHRNVDSLKKALYLAKNPIERFDILNRIAEDYYNVPLKRGQVVKM